MSGGWVRCVSCVCGRKEVHGTSRARRQHAASTPRARRAHAARVPRVLLSIGSSAHHVTTSASRPACFWYAVQCTVKWRPPPPAPPELLPAASFAESSRRCEQYFGAIS